MYASNILNENGRRNVRVVRGVSRAGMANVVPVKGRRPVAMIRRAGMGSILSQVFHSVTGVPLGSVLGPIAGIVTGNPIIGAAVGGIATAGSNRSSPFPTAGSAPAGSPQTATSAGTGIARAGSSAVPVATPGFVSAPGTDLSTGIQQLIDAAFGINAPNRTPPFQPAGVPQAQQQQQPSDNTALYIGGGILAAALLFASVRRK